MVNALSSGLSGAGSSPGWGHCVVFWDKALNSHGASLHPDQPIVRRLLDTHLCHFTSTASDMDSGSEAICRRDAESYASQRGS